MSKAIDKLNGKHLVDIGKFGEYIKERRLAKGYTLRQLDDAMGTNTAASWWEGRKSGIQLPSLETYQRLKVVLELDSRFDSLIEWAEAEREVVGKHPAPLTKSDTGRYQWNVNGEGRTEIDLTAPATEAAKQWSGWGTSLKPAHEIIVCARKPLSESSVARNVLRWGVGGLNIDGSRIGWDAAGLANDGKRRQTPRTDITNGSYGKAAGARPGEYEGEKSSPSKRWPANVLFSHSPECQRVGVKRVRAHWSQPTRGNLDASMFNPGDKQKGENVGYADPDGFETTEAWECARDEAGNYLCPVALLDEQSGNRKVGGERASYSTAGKAGIFQQGGRSLVGYADQGGASRYFLNLEGEPGFFYSAKSSRSERNAFTKSLPRTRNQRKRYQQDRSGRWYKRVSNTHPTVKPLKLLSHLVKLVTPPGGTVLDPFAGSGTTGVACVELGFDFIGIEQSKEYLTIAQRRIDWASQGQNQTEPNRPVEKQRRPACGKQDTAQLGLFDLPNPDKASA